MQTRFRLKMRFLHKKKMVKQHIVHKILAQNFGFSGDVIYLRQDLRKLCTILTLIPTTIATCIFETLLQNARNEFSDLEENRTFENIINFKCTFSCLLNINIYEYFHN